MSRRGMSASLIGRLGSVLSSYPPIQCRCLPRVRASLRNRHQGPSIMGFEDEAERSFGRPCHQSEAGPSRHTISPHPSSREGLHATARGNSSFLLSVLILHGFHAAVAACARVHQNSVPLTHMRFMITASRRASATTAFFSPRRLHRFVRREIPDACDLEARATLRLRPQ